MHIRITYDVGIFSCISNSIYTLLLSKIRCTHARPLMQFIYYYYMCIYFTCVFACKSVHVCVCVYLCRFILRLMCATIALFDISTSLAYHFYNVFVYIICTQTLTMGIVLLLLLFVECQSANTNVLWIYTSA